MSSASASADADRPQPTVFLSYASEDRPAARRIGDALPAYGLEVWYDESELGGGDAWDQKIRKQIRECDYFMALVSAQTEARHEGYFRREWRLAVERTLDMADDHAFLLPIVIDGTDQAGARVPEKFLAVQWLRVPGGEPTPALEALCRRLVSGDSGRSSAAKKTPPRLTTPAAPTPTVEHPEFPREEPGQRLRFLFSVIGWALRSAWIYFKKLPRWARILAYVWIGVVLLSKGCTPKHREPTQPPLAEAQRLKAITDQYGGSSKADIAKLGAQIGREFAVATEGKVPVRRPLLAVPFTAPAGDAAGEKLAVATFAQVYGRVSISHPRQVGLSKEPLPSSDLAVALERGRASHSTYIIFGSVDNDGAAKVLTIKIATVEDGDIVWSNSYPAAGADSATIAAEVDSKVPSLDDD